MGPFRSSATGGQDIRSGLGKGVARNWALIVGVFEKDDVVVLEDIDPVEEDKLVVVSENSMNDVVEGMKSFIVDLIS